ncbi:MAG TPA: TIGR00341 family protein [Terriglobia bacterium]|nr:TIGR00341 family protein [Terriglobia bacterium]
MPSTPTEGTFYRRLPLRASREQRDAIYGSVLKTGLVDTEYASMLALSGLIALFGLLQNSQAVIIGAMLISPLMNPILSGALALLLGDGRLGRRSAAVLGLSVAGVIVITWLVAWLSPLKQATPEILARTNPNLLDLFIAFLSGLAGTLALRNSNATLTIVPGVAIAVAVVPPLAVVGYGLSTHQAEVAGGAFLLFVTNLVSIIISAAVVFRLMGFRPHEEAEKSRLNFVFRMGLSAGILLVLSIPLLQTLRKGVSQLRMRAELTRAMNAVFETPHSSVSDLSFSQAGDGLRVRTTLRTTRYFETGQIDEAARLLRARFGLNAKLDVDQILVAQGGISPEEAARLGNAISGGVVRAEPKPAPFDFKVSGEKILGELEKHVDETLAGTPLLRVGDARLELSAAPPLRVDAGLSAPEPLEAQTVRLLADQLSARLSVPAQLHGEAQLSGAAYGAALEVPKSHPALTTADRQKLAALARLVARRPDLQLRITYLPAEGEAKRAAGALRVAAWPPALADLKRVLSASRLPAAQWTLQPGAAAAPAPAVPAPASGNAKPTATAAPAPPVAAAAAAAPLVRYECQTVQRF